MPESNPADYTVEEIKAHVEENPAQATAVLEAEKARGEDARKSLVALLEKAVEKQNMASSPVTVETAAAPGLLDKFEVTPERGYRVKG